ncbi:MAG: hypothetical protein RL701_3130, partial [Pseudomonadota bacterium]
MARTGRVDGKLTRNAELEVRLLTKAGLASPRIVLSPTQVDWSCECPSQEEACIHVAAAVIGLRKAQEDGTPLTAAAGPAIKLAHRLRKIEGSLALERFIIRNGESMPLQTRLAAWKRRDGDDDVNTNAADLALDVALGPVVSGKIPRPLMKRVLAALGDCPDVTFEGARVKIGEPRPVIRARVDDSPEGFRVFAEQDPEVQEIFDNGAVMHSGVLRAVGDLDLSGRDVDELRKGRTYTFGQVADLVGRVIPALRERLPVEIASKLLPSATAMQPRLLAQTDFVDGALNVLPLLVYGDPPCARVDGGKLHFLGGALPLRNEDRERKLIDDLSGRTGLTVGQSARFMGRAALAAAERIRGMGHLAVQGDGLAACFVSAPLSPDFELTDDRSNFTFVSEGEGGQRHATGAAVIEAWRRGEEFVPLIEGGFAPLPLSVLTRVGDLLADLLAAKRDDDTLPACALPDLARLCEALQTPAPPSFVRLRELLGDHERIPPTDLPTDLNAQLRDYQRDGVNWLAFLSQANLGAMLADDMGLGKTLQALCVVQKPTLVVAPASVLHNWAAEIQRFRPTLQVHTYHGPNRSLSDEADITLTT